MQSQPRDESQLDLLPQSEQQPAEATLDPEPHWHEIIDAATD
jgi:hypothetical protein